MTEPTRPSKREAFAAFFAEGWVSVHLDARKDGVELPVEFRQNSSVVLQYGSNMPIPIPDLDVSENGIRATLSFARTPRATFIPWSAVYIVACTDGRGVLYLEDAPEEIVLMARKAIQELEPARPRETVCSTATKPTVDDTAPGTTENDKAERATPTRSRPALGLVPAESEDGEIDGNASRRRKPKLRLVK